MATMTPASLSKSIQHDIASSWHRARTCHSTSGSGLETNASSASWQHAHQLPCNAPCLSHRSQRSQQGQQSVRVSGWRTRGTRHRLLAARAQLQQQGQAENKSALKEKAAVLAPDLKGTSIFLVGMMGSGKSTVGKLLAEGLSYMFFDSDSVVEQAAGGASVAQIFEENGEEAFRDVESAVIAELASMGRLVVATGGGVVLRPTNWSAMHHTVTVHLHAPIEHLANRVATDGVASRPLLGANEEGSSPQDDAYQQALERLTRIWSERKQMYGNADVIVSLEDLDSELGVGKENISPEIVALKVIEEIQVLVTARKLKDEALRASSQNSN